MVGGKIYKVCGLSRGEEIQDREREAKIQGMRLINYHEYLDTRYVVEARRYKISVLSEIQSRGNIYIQGMWSRQGDTRSRYVQSMWSREREGEIGWNNVGTITAV